MDTDRNDCLRSGSADQRKGGQNVYEGIQGQKSDDYAEFWRDLSLAHDYITYQPMVIQTSP